MVFSDKLVLVVNSENLAPAQRASIRKQNTSKGVSVFFSVLNKEHQEAGQKPTPVSLVFRLFVYVNDPSAGSPTETLLRLLLPLDEQICTTLVISSTRRFH